MIFIVTLIALLIERFFDWSHLRHWSWFIAYQRMVMKRIPTISPYLILVSTIVPLLLGIFLIEYIIDDWLYGVVTLLFNLLVFLYCLGPQNLWADAFACINALVQGDTNFAADKLRTAFGITNTRSVQSLHRELLNHIFIAANSRVFAIVFWYVLLGPIGAILYRMVTLCSNRSNQNTIPELSQSAYTVEAVLDFVPIRILTFIFALGGHFVHVLNCWRQQVLLGMSHNESLLIDCGTAALNHEDQAKLPEDGTAEKGAIGLLDRTFVIVLVLIAIGGLVG